MTSFMAYIWRKKSKTDKLEYGSESQGLTLYIDLLWPESSNLCRLCPDTDHIKFKSKPYHAHCPRSHKQLSLHVPYWRLDGMIVIMTLSVIQGNTHIQPAPARCTVGLRQHHFRCADYIDSAGEDVDYCAVFMRAKSIIINLFVTLDHFFETVSWWDIHYYSVWWLHLSSSQYCRPWPGMALGLGLHTASLTVG